MEALPLQTDSKHAVMIDVILNKKQTEMHMCDYHPLFQIKWDKCKKFVLFCYR